MLAITSAPKMASRCSPSLQNSEVPPMAGRRVGRVILGNPAHQARDRVELTAEHVVHHDRVAAIGHRLGLDHCGLLKGHLHISPSHSGHAPIV